MKKVELEASTKADAKAIQDAFTARWRGKSPPAEAIEAKNRQIVAVADNAITQVTPAWNHYEEVLRKRIALRRRYMSAIVAQLGDPLWHEKALSFTVNDGEGDFDVDLLMRIRAVYNEVSLVGRNLENRREVVESGGEFSDEDSPCCGGHEGPTVSVEITEIVKAKVDCRSVAVEVGTKGWLGVFGSVKLDMNGRMTVFAGPKAKLEYIGLGTSVGMKDGLYITVDSKGVQDVGARVEFSTEQMIAPGVSLQQKLDSMDFSFVPSA